MDQAFACSYRELSASAARLFRSLATTLDPGSTITAEEAAALMTTSLPAGRRLLEYLVVDAEEASLKLSTAQTVQKHLASFASASGNGMRCVGVVDCERFTDQAANRLLKLLEEPPPRSQIQFGETLTLPG